MADTDVGGMNLNHKVGPLPLWGWIGAVGLGLAYGWYRRAHQNADAGTVQLPGSQVDDLGTTVPGVGNAAVSTAPSTSAPAPVDNQQWSVLAQQRLIALGYDPATVSTALSLWLSGANLTPQQQAIVSEAIRAAGPAPEPVPPPVTTPTTPAPITPTPAANHHYVVEFHRVGTVGTSVDARAYIQSLSTGYNANDIQTALLATVNDPRNAGYKASYARNHGKWPGGAGLYITVVKAGAA